jgi:hypothetical protein
MLAILILAGGSAVTGGAARAEWDETRAQAQCELSAIRDTKSPLGLSWIRTACNRLAIDTGPLHESNRKFHACLLEHLPGVASDEAASRIVSACRASNPPL